MMQQAQILLVEDDHTLCDMLGRNLRARGHQLTIVHDVAGALDTLKTRSINLILLDINLPDQTGWDLLRALISAPELCPRLTADGRIPVVVLSAVRVSKRRLDEFRPLAYLSKPFPLEAVLRLAAQALAYTDTSVRPYLPTG